MSLTRFFDFARGNRATTGKARTTAVRRNGGLARTVSELQIAGSPVPLILKRHGSAQRMSLRADPYQRVIRVTGPARTSADDMAAFARSRLDWLTARVAEWPPAVALQPGQRVIFDGTARMIVHHARAGRAIVLKDDALLVCGPSGLVAPRLIRWFRQRAREMLDAPLQEMAALVTDKPVRLRLGDPKGRWGSCSASGTISLSWRLALAPAHVRHYLLAHEVAHLAHMNHGPAFWALARELNGGPVQPAERWLRQHGAGLHAVGAPCR